MTSNVLGSSGGSDSATAEPLRGRLTAQGMRTGAVAVLGALYILQALTPLRLDNDAVVYLRMATSLSDGMPMDRTGLPPGYPALIALLDTVGLGFPFVLVLVNVAFIAAGLAAAHDLFDDREPGRASWVVPLTMVSVAVVRYLPMPLPESMFFGISMTAVALMTAGTRSIEARRGWLLAGALALTIAAIMVRLVGVALLPALIWSCLRGGAWGTSARAGLTRRDKLTVAATLAGVALIATFALGDSLAKYSYEAQLRYSQIESLWPVWLHARGFIWTLGEVVLNLPWTQFRPYRMVFFWVGFASVVGLVTLVRLRRPATPAGVSRVVPDPACSLALHGAQVMASDRSLVHRLCRKCYAAFQSRAKVGLFDSRLRGVVRVRWSRRDRVHQSHHYFGRQFPQGLWQGRRNVVSRPGHRSCRHPS